MMAKDLMAKDLMAKDLMAKDLMAKDLMATEPGINRRPTMSRMITIRMRSTFLLSITCSRFLSAVWRGSILSMIGVPSLFIPHSPVYLLPIIRGRPRSPLSYRSICFMLR
jgi:hypothetical protein